MDDPKILSYFCLNKPSNPNYLGLLCKTLNHSGDVETLRLLLDNGCSPNVPIGAEKLILVKTRGVFSLMMKVMLKWSRSKTPPYVSVSNTVQVLILIRRACEANIS